MEKKEPDTIKRESDHFLRLIQVVFGVVLVQGLTLNREVIVDPFSSDNFLPFSCLIVILTTTVMSWMDFHRTVERTPYIIDRFLEKIRVGSDVLVVVAYAYVLFTIEHVKGKSNVDLSGYLLGFWLIFFFYYISGFLRTRTYGPAASRRNLILIYFLVYLAFWISYNLFAVQISFTFASEKITNYAAVFLVLVIMISYRVVRTRRIKQRQEIQKKGLRIGVDVDGVLADQISGVSERVIRKYGISFSYEDVTEWEFKIGRSDIAKEIEEALLNDPTYASEMPMHSSANETIKTLWSHNWITIITARPKDVDFLTKRWLNKNDVLYDEYINSRLVEKSTHGVDLLIDDYIGNVKRVLQDTHHCAILFDRPWNQDRSSLRRWKKSGRFFVVKNWTEVEPIVQSIKSTKGLGNQ